MRDRDMQAGGTGCVTAGAGLTRHLPSSPGDREDRSRPSDLASPKEGEEQGVERAGLVPKMGRRGRWGGGCRATEEHPEGGGGSAGLGGTRPGGHGREDGLGPRCSRSSGVDPVPNLARGIWSRHPCPEQWRGGGGTHRNGALTGSPGSPSSPRSPLAPSWPCEEGKTWSQHEALPPIPPRIPTPIPGEAPSSGGRSPVGVGHDTHPGTHFTRRSGIAGKANGTLKQRELPTWGDPGPPPQGTPMLSRHPAPSPCPPQSGGDTALTGLPLGPSSPGGPFPPGGPAAPAAPASPFSPRSPRGPCGTRRGQQPAEGEVGGDKDGDRSGGVPAVTHLDSWLPLDSWSPRFTGVPLKQEQREFKPPPHHVTPPTPLRISPLSHRPVVSPPR